eukprot:2150682-Rhodomonas_salina.2
MNPPVAYFEYVAAERLRVVQRGEGAQAFVSDRVNVLGRVVPWKVWDDGAKVEDCEDILLEDL